MGPRMKYYLWLVLALRLCMAVLPQLPVSVYGPVAQVTDTRPALYYTSPESLGESFFDLELRGIQPIEPTAQVQEPGLTAEDVVPLVWLIWSTDDGLTRVSFAGASLKYEYIHL